jgi:hypothetical protein
MIASRGMAMTVRMVRTAAAPAPARTVEAAGVARMAATAHTGGKGLRPKDWDRSRRFSSSLLARLSESVEINQNIDDLCAPAPSLGRGTRTIGSTNEWNCLSLFVPRQELLCKYPDGYGPLPEVRADAASVARATLGRADQRRVPFLPASTWYSSA